MPCAFSVRDKLFKGKETVRMPANDKQEHLGARQHNRVSTGITSLASYAGMLIGSDTDLGDRIECN